VPILKIIKIQINTIVLNLKALEKEEQAKFQITGQREIIKAMVEITETTMQRGSMT
jgi:hypothetical protein